MIDIDPNIEKEISLFQEQKLNSKIKEDIKRVVKVVEKPEDKLADFFSVINSEKKQVAGRSISTNCYKHAHVEMLTFFAVWP